MAKARKDATQDEEMFGGSSLLNRIGTGGPIIEAEQDGKGRRGFSRSGSGDAKTSERQSAEASVEEAAKNLRTTVYLPPEQVNALDEQIIKIRRSTGAKRDRSALISEAIDLWLSTHNEK